MQWRQGLTGTMVACAACAVLAGATAAQPAPASPPVPAASGAAPKPWPSFTFKRVSAPPAGRRGRIDVQIDPAAQRAALAPPRATAPAPATSTSKADAVFPAFWAATETGLSASSGRFQRAMAALDGGGPPAPRLATLEAIARAHGAAIMAASVGTRVSPALVLAVIAVESAGDAEAESASGARGLMQLIEATAARFGAEDRNDPVQNIRAGVAYLDWLLETFDQDPVLALAGYNAGENAVRASAGVPPFAETRAYVPKVLAAWKVARALCLTPPELVSDGCVLAPKGAPADG